MVTLKEWIRRLTERLSLSFLAVIVLGWFIYTCITRWRKRNDHLQPRQGAGAGGGGGDALSPDESTTVTPVSPPADSGASSAGLPSAGPHGTYNSHHNHANGDTRRTGGGGGGSGHNSSAAANGNNSRQDPSRSSSSRAAAGASSSSSSRPSSAGRSHNRHSNGAATRSSTSRQSASRQRRSNAVDETTPVAPAPSAETRRDDWRRAIDTSDDMTIDAGTPPPSYESVCDDPPSYNQVFIDAKKPRKGSVMNVTYIPMGSMQVGPNGELIPTNISFAGADGRPATFQQVLAPASSSTSGSPQAWKVSDLTPVYSAPQNFAVMEPLSINSAGVVQLTGGQLIQAPGGGQIFQVQIPQQQLQTLQQQQQQPQQPQQIQIQQLPTLQQHAPQPSSSQSGGTPKMKSKSKLKAKAAAAAAAAAASQVATVPQIEFKTIPDALQQFTIQPDGQLVQFTPEPPPPPLTAAQVIKVPAKKSKNNHNNAANNHHQQQQQQFQVITAAEAAAAVASSTASDFTVIKVDNLFPLQGQLEQETEPERNEIPLSPPKKPKKKNKNSERKNEGKTPHICLLCSKDFKSKGNLKRHHKDFHSSDSTEKVTYHCDLCKKDFQNRFNLRRHRIGVHGAAAGKTTDFPCEICLKVFNYGDNLKRHKKNVHGIIGDGSEASTTTVDGQVLHFNSAGEIVSTDGSGTLAIKTNGEEGAVVEAGAHGAIKTFICEICDKNLQSSYNLKRHKAAVHKETRILYGCDECDKNFTSITNYRRHKIMIHGPGKEANKCQKCDKVLASKDGLKRHMESVHELLAKNFVCPTCGNRFLRKEYLIKHLKTHEFNYEVLPADTTTSS